MPTDTFNRIRCSWRKFGVNALVDHMNFVCGRTIKFDNITFGMVTDGDNGVGSLDKNGHGHFEKKAVAHGMVLWIALEDQIMHGQHGGTAQVRKQMFRSVVEGGGSEGAFVKGQVEELSGENAKAPGKLALVDGFCFGFA